MNIKKLLRVRLVFLFFWIALPNLVFAADASCTISGALRFDPQWIQTINANIQNREGAYLDWQSLQLRTGPVYEPSQVIEFLREFPKDQRFFHADSITIPETTVECNQKYYLYFGYVIHNLEHDGGPSRVWVLTTTGNTQINALYPSEFNTNH